MSPFARPGKSDYAALMRGVVLFAVDPGKGLSANGISAQLRQAPDGLCDHC